jgi:hypothetical protein
MDRLMPFWQRHRVKLLLVVAGRCGVVMNVHLGDGAITCVHDEPLLILQCECGGPEEKWAARGLRHPRFNIAQGPVDSGSKQWAAPWAQHRGPDVRLEWPPLRDLRDDR